MIHYYYGTGKGKTSAALGACLRALGCGMRCAVVQFLKDGSSSEITPLRKLGADIYACTSGVRFFKKMTDAERIAVINTHNENLTAILNCKYDLIVLDELGDAFARGAADPILVDNILFIPDCELIITGHKPLPQFISCADYITEFRCIAHPYKKGIKARKGIEF